MSIDARISDVLYNDDGTATLDLVSRDRYSDPGQSVLHVENPPKGRQLDSAIGCCIWGNASTIMMGNKKWADRLSYLTIRLACLLLLISGCLPPRGDGAPEPTPTPPANVSAIAREAAQFPQRLAAGYAEEAESMAGRAAEFTDWESFNRTWGEGNAKRRQAAFEPTAKAIAEAVGGEEAGYDRERAAAAFRELAKGLRGEK